VTVRHVSTVGGEEDSGISSSSSVTSHSSRGCATTAATEAEAAAAAGSLPPPQKLKKKKKTVFVIRHGESKWNEAQAAKHVGHMLKQFDHELDTVGITQARDFNAKWKAMAVEAGLLLPLPPDEVKKAEVVEGGEAAGAGAVAAATSTTPSTTASSSQDGDQPQQQQQLVEFLSAGAIYASPLTRATQTALLTCQDHPFFVGAETETTTGTTSTSATAATATISNPETEEGKKKRGGGGALKLVRAVREVKSTPMGSLDTVGERKGGEIKKHVEACLSADGGATLEVEKVVAPEVIHRDATDHW
jgi:phosphohistidine phosphatase SixA